MKRFFIAIAAICLTTIAMPDAQAQKAVRVQRATQQITSGNGRYYMHTVAKGQTLYAIAQAYQVSEEAILEKNPFLANGLKARQSILVPTAETYAAWVAQKQKSAAKQPKTEKKEVVKPVDVGVKDEKKVVKVDESSDKSVVEPSVEPVVEHKVVRTGKGRAIGSNGVIEVAMMLPFKENNSRANENFTDFYKGSLIALNVLKSKGVSVKLNVIAVDSNVESVIERGALDEANLIIGPVYESAFVPVAEYATKNHVPIVSPLAVMNKVESPYAFQAAPSDENKYGKLKSVIQNPMAKVIMLNHSSYREDELYNDLKKLLPETAVTINYSKEMATSTLSDMLDKEMENVVVIPVDNESAVEEALSRISSINAAGRYKITVIGSSRWARFNNINFEMFFKLNTMYVTNYHADKSNPAVAHFYSEYVKAFGSLPSMYSMRGYDVTLMFVGALDSFGAFMPMRTDDFGGELLQVDYKFKQKSDTATFRNTNWLLVNYTPQFLIDVK